MTTKELLELILAGNYAKKLDFNKEALQDIINSKVDGSATDRAMYEKAIKSLVERLDGIERNGYSPLKEEKIDCTNENDENDPQDSCAKNKKYSKSETEESKSSKKKKKKKAQANYDDAEESSVSASVSSMAKPEPKVDLVSMLQAMGFAENQIHAAADACGGTDRATADDLIEWILSGGTSDSNNPNNEIDESIGDTYTNRESVGRELNTLRVGGLEQKQKRAAMQAEIEAEKAAKREAEVKAAAERLAAKREEQRRIRREWNNREQLRQQEEANTKLAEEVERKRRIEIEKAKVTAQRVAQERAATSAAMMYQDTNTTIPPVMRVGAVLPVTNSSNIGATPLFPGTVFQGGNVQNLLSENQYYPDMQSPNLIFGQPMMMQQATNLSYTQTTPNFRIPPNANADPVVLTPGCSGSRAKSKKASPVNLEVNGYEFPVLGSNKASTPTKRHKSKNKDSPNGGENRKVGKSKKKKNETPFKDKRSIELASPTPTIPSGQSLNDQNAAVQNESYESNPLGEIRATAKAFVPTHFTPSRPQTPPGLVNIPTSVPPGLVPSSISSNPLLPSSILSGSSILPNTSSSILTRNSVAATSIRSNSAGSILPGHSTPNDTNSRIPNSTIAQQYNKSLSNNPISLASPLPSTISSVVGLLAPEENLTLSFHSLSQNDTLLGSTRLGGLPSSSIVGSSLGMLESNTPAPSLSGSSIWGGAPAAAPIIPTTNLGVFSFNFGDNTVATNTGDEAHKKDNTTNQSGMWGAGGVSSGNGGGGGSIW